MIIPAIDVPDSTHCGTVVSFDVSELVVPDYTECPYSGEIPTPPPIVYIRYASGSYPLNPVEAISPSLLILSGHYLLHHRTVEGIDTSLSVTGGSYPQQVRYLSTLVQPEAITANLTILGGTNPLIVRYLSTTVSPEAISTSLTVTGGTYPLTVRYLNTSVQPEAINSTLAILGGAYA